MLACAASCGSVYAAESALVEWDWHFRESLTAICGWEAILAESGIPGDTEPLLFPLPEDGSSITWPNPFPAPLLPPEDRAPSVTLRLVGGDMAVESPHAEPRIAPLSEPVEVYHHPGGGGSDRWYHPYVRRFDAFTHVRGQPAPFSLEMPPTLDWQRGVNELALTLRSVTDRTVDVECSLRCLRPGGREVTATGSARLAPGDIQGLTLPLSLDEPGGSVCLLDLECEGARFSLPLLAHVEDVEAVLAGIERILTDMPDREGARALARLQAQASEWRHDGNRLWRELFHQASALRDRLLLSRLDFDELLFIKRAPFDSEQPFMDAHHLINRPGGAIYRLSPPSPRSVPEVLVDSLGEGIYRDLRLDWEARKLLFAFGNGSDKWDGSQSYHIYEVPIAGGAPEQLTFGPKNDCEPFYLPDGRIGFTSDRPEHFVMCGGDRHAPLLFSMAADGSDIQQLSHNVFNDFNPSMLGDGRILYSRWEYNERSVTSLHNPFTMNPDGSMVAPYYGNATIRPNVVMFPREVPGSGKVMALFTAHHGQTHGAVGLIDGRVDVDGPEPITLLTPGVPITGEKHEDSQVGWYSDPWPLSETTYLCSYTPTVVPWLANSWALYVGDRHGNLALICRDLSISCFEPVPVITTPRPHLRPSPALAAQGNADVVLMDVYEGLEGVPRGEARYLRVVEDVPRVSVPNGGVIVTSGTPIYTIKRMLGIVPIEPDGSARISAPSNRNVYFEVLDENQVEIQRMRSVLCLRPNELRTCVGCHEPRNTAPPNQLPIAAHSPANAPQPPPWGDQAISFLREVQPLLNDHCAACHTHDRWSNTVLLTDDLTDQFTVAYEELLPYVAVANAMGWDTPEDVYPQPPYTYGSGASALVKLIEEGHHGVSLPEDERLALINWVDANAVYYDRYDPGPYPDRRIFAGPEGRILGEIYDRRCAECHGPDDASLQWRTLNRRDPTLSRMLQAPLSRDAGGWGRCGDEVFATVADPDYVNALAALTALWERLAKEPRADLLSIRGTPAESQWVMAPEPPERQADEGNVDGTVPLGDLAWISASAGWTAAGDNVPRVDRDVEGRPLRCGQRLHRRGIGTHAPSEIRYDLEGRYARLLAEVAAAESGGSVVFEVYGDGRLLWSSGVMRGLGAPASVEVPVAGMRTLTLVVSDAGDGYIADMANWGSPRLVPE
ncbi:MAG: NPCBM/NEW2 domain-containing protein [Acidobacteriota bacterium]|nr:NPCBM/NEW2 domain-containing protein [Acidobacteriota bacterium]